MMMRISVAKVEHGHTTQNSFTWPLNDDSLETSDWKLPVFDW